MMVKMLEASPYWGALMCGQNVTLFLLESHGAAKSMRT